MPMREVSGLLCILTEIAKATTANPITPSAISSHTYPRARPLTHCEPPALLPWSVDSMNTKLGLGEAVD